MHGKGGEELRSRCVSVMSEYTRKAVLEEEHDLKLALRGRHAWVYEV